jgi:hypothetical protein
MWMNVFRSKDPDAPSDARGAALLEPARRSPPGILGALFRQVHGGPSIHDRVRDGRLERLLGSPSGSDRRIRASPPEAVL